MSDETPDTTGLREVLAADEVSELVGDDIRYWLGNPFMDPSLMVQKVCHWVTVALAAHPTPDASPDPAVVTPDAGDNIVQRIVNAWDCCGTCAGGVLANHVAAAREADRAECAALADRVIAEWSEVPGLHPTEPEPHPAAIAAAGARRTLVVLRQRMAEAFNLPADAATALDAVKAEAKAENDAQRSQDAASLRTVAAELVRRDLVNIAGIVLRVAARLDAPIPPASGDTAGGAS